MHMVMNEVDITITIKSKRYPCYPTAGAMLRFRRKKGKEVNNIDLGDIDELGTYLWCCAASACRREEVAFEFRDEQEFMDCLLPGDITSWAQSLVGGATEPSESADEKKSPSE